MLAPEVQAYDSTHPRPKDMIRETQRIHARRAELIAFLVIAIFSCVAGCSRQDNSAPPGADITNRWLHFPVMRRNLALITS